jgi:zinc protease
MNPASWHRSVLPGGLVLATSQRRSPGILAARLWLAGGSGVDPAGQRGLHQLLAGLLTRGCGDLDATALADLVEGRGAALRTEASEDNLLISLKCASGDGAVLLPLLLQMVARPRLEDDQIALERSLNLQALQRQREDPFQLCHAALRQQIYGSGPYGHDPLGVAEELEELGRDELAQLASGLGSRGAVLVIAGSLPDGLEQILERALRHTPWHAAPPGQDAAIAQVEPFGPGLQRQEEDTEQVVLMLGCATPPLGDEDSLALRVLQAHLGLGMSSRLFVEMREERGLAYDVGVHMPARRGPTPYIWHLSCSNERAGEAATALLDAWQRLQNVALAPQELELALAKYQGQDAMGRQTCGQIADRQALLLGFGLPEDFIERCLQQVRAFTAEGLLQTARRCLQQPQLSLCGAADGLDAAQQAWEQHPLSRSR